MHERTSLIHSVPPPRRPRNERRSSPLQSPPNNDLLDISDNLYSPRVSSYPHIYQRHNISEARDVDLIQMNDLDESNFEPQSPLSTPESNHFHPSGSGTVSKLQQRMHGRKNLNFVGDVIHPDNDDDETDNEDESRLLDFNDLEMETTPVVADGKEQSFIPLHDLTSSSNQIMKKTPMELRQYKNNVSDAFKYIKSDRADSDVKLSSLQYNSTPIHASRSANDDASEYTPTRGLRSSAIQSHAKRAVSSLFGSSVIVPEQEEHSDFNNDRYEMKVLHSNTTSLLDTVKV